jgi:multiple sugar transport system substrate-binding protein
MKLRRLSTILLVFALVLAMVPAALAEEPITLRFLMFQDSNFDNRVAAREKYLEKYFYPDNPNVKIEYEYIPFNDMESKAITSFAGGVSYDLMIVNHPAIVQYKEAGMLLPLNDYLKSAGIDFDSYFSASIAKCGVFDGTVYSIPRDTDTRVLAVNKKLFKEAGLNYPTTTAEMVECAKALTKDTDGDGVTDQYGMLLEASGAYHPTYELGQFLLGNGVKVFTQGEDGKYFSQLNTQGAKDFMDFSKALVETGPEDFISYDGSKIFSLFCQGKLGMYIFGSWNITNADLAEAVKNGLEYDLILNPKGTDHSGASQGGYHYAISSQTKYPELCWKVLEALSKPDAAAEICYTEGGLPCVLDSYKEEPFSNGLYDVIAEQIKTAEVPVPQISVTNEIVTEIWYNAWLSAMLGETTNEEALNSAYEEITGVLNDYMAK